MLRIIVLVLITVAATIAPAAAAELKVGLAAPVTSVDPHFFNAVPNNSLAMHLFDRLTERGPDLKLRPGLAISWKPVQDTVWEFRLRPGVTFHDGSVLTADDVVFSIGRAPHVPNSPGGYAGYLRAIERVEIVDAVTIRFLTRSPAPNLPADLASVSILSRKISENAATSEYNSGRAAIGTGAYKLAYYAPGDRVELNRNDAWWGEQPEWERVSIRFIPSAAARVAALLTGDVDLIDAPAAADLPRLKATSTLSIYAAPGVRTIYLYLDFFRAGEEPFITNLSGEKLAKNPMLDLRVRRALSLAINREGLTTRVMEATAAPTGQWVTAGMLGYNPAVRVPRFDPDLAKSLLADAGFPRGLKLTLHAPNDRYPNDSATAQAVAQMWSRIGVQTAVQTLPWANYATRAANQEWSIGLWGWGTNTGEAGNALINLLGTWDATLGRGSINHGRYSNPTLDALTDKALSTIDDKSRDDLLQQAVSMATEDIGIIPLYQLAAYWAVRKGLMYEARGDERTLAMNVHSVR